MYQPWNYYYTREPRGFGFVKYRYAEDAAKAMKLKKRHWPQKPSKNTSSMLTFKISFAEEKG
ncbi:unnamed protein product [Brassica oleracea var. botrytis]|uniref:RRM domain-containing protein n=1 Tax=Brassica oleracea TaxID=3712 RepID=A0A3P6E5Q3_BRAOL|nr:unnamed protein product [Brassica oleracea]